MDEVHLLLVNQSSPWSKPDYQPVSIHRTPDGARAEGRKQTHENDGDADSELADLLPPGYVVKKLTIQD